LTRHILAMPPTTALRVIPPDIHDLGTLFPVLGRSDLIGPVDPSSEPEGDLPGLRRRAVKVLRELLREMAKDKALALWIDDLQWGDSDSAVLLAELIAPPDPPGMLVILGYRSEEIGRSRVLQSFLGAKSVATWPQGMVVGAISREDACLVAATLLEDPKAAGTPLVTSIADESLGNPFLIGELARFVATRNRISTRGLRLETMLHERLAALAPQAKALLEVVAVASAPLHPDIAYRAAQLPVEERDKALSTLRVEHFVRSSGERDEQRVEPYHDRIRESLIATLGPGREATCHRALALAFADSGPADAEALCTHFLAAGIADRAAEYAEIAATRAATQLAFDRAAHFYRVAIEQRPNDPKRHELARHLGDALANAGRGREAADAYLSAAEGAAPEGKLDLIRRAGEQLLESGHLDQGHDLLGQALSEAGLGTISSPLRSLVVLLLMRLWLKFRGFGYREIAEAQCDPAALRRADLCAAVALAIGVADRISAARYQTRSLLLTLALGEPRRLTRSLAAEAAFLSTEGGEGYRKATALLERARTLASKLNHPDTDAIVEAAAGFVHHLNARWSSALDHFDRAEKLYEHSGTAAWAGERDVVWLYGITAAIYSGRLLDVGRRLPALQREARDRGDLFLSTNLAVSETNLTWLFQDDPASARNAIVDAMQRWSQRGFHTPHWWALISEAYIDLYEGKPNDALMRFERLWPAARASFIPKYVQFARIVCLYVWGAADLAAAARAATAERARLAEHGAVCARRILRERTAWGDALASLLRGGVASVRGDRDTATWELERAIPDLYAVQMPLWASAASIRLGDAKSGGEAQELRRDSFEWMTIQGVRAPDKVSAMLVPGFAELRLTM
jgi:hypothetical protein